MANCSACGRDVGCGCNLINGSCAGCFNKNLTDGDQAVPQQRKLTKRITYNNSPNAPENTEFMTVLNSQGLSREDKLKRINDILEKSRQTI